MDYIHKWAPSEECTPSGKMLFVCKKCGLRDVAPVKAVFERRRCIPNGVGVEQNKEE